MHKHSLEKQDDDVKNLNDCSVLSSNGLNGRLVSWPKFLEQPSYKVTDRLVTTIRVLLYFFAPIVGLPAIELAVAEIFGFSFFGFLVSFLLFLPLAITCPSKMQRSYAQMA